MRASSTTWPVSRRSASDSASGCTSTGRTGVRLSQPRVCVLFNGIERADSFIVDPHKWLFATYDCCALLYRQPELARAAHSQHAGYLDAIDREVWNPWDYGVHLTRRARGLPFWFSLATHGTNRYAAAIEQTLTTARAVAEGPGASPSCPCSWSRPCRWCCSSDPAGTTSPTGAGRGDSRSRAGSCAFRRMDGSDRPAAGLREPGDAGGRRTRGARRDHSRSKSSLGNARADQLAGDPGRADSLAGIVGDDNFVAGNRPAEMHGSGGAGHPASCHRAVMCRVDVHPDRDPPPAARR